MTRHAVSQPNWRRYQLSFLKMGASHWRRLMTWSSKNVDVSRSPRIWSICGKIPSKDRHCYDIKCHVISRRRLLASFVTSFYLELIFMNKLALLAMKIILAIISTKFSDVQFWSNLRMEWSGQFNNTENADMICKTTRSQSSDKAWPKQVEL